MSGDDNTPAIPPAFFERLDPAPDEFFYAEPRFVAHIDPETIDDLAQSALVKVELNLDRFEGRSKFRTWVHSIARNEALMHLRRQRGDVDALDADDDTPDLSPRLSTVIAGRATLRQALDGLPEPYRSTMVMRVDEELDYQQIADQLSVPVGTIRSRLAKARVLLGEALLVA